jgi:hypothetical protein
MCLYIDKELTDKKLESFKRKGIKEIVVWKCLIISNRVAYAPYRPSYRYHKGKNIIEKNIKNLFYDVVTGRRRSTYSPFYNAITKGSLHVYSTRQYARDCSLKSTVIRCRVKVEDIIAYGQYGDIAVKALYIDKFSEKS